MTEPQKPPPTAAEQLRAVNGAINKGFEIGGMIGTVIEIVGGVVLAAALVSVLRSSK